MRFLLAYLLVCAGLISVSAQPAGVFNRPMMNQPSIIAPANNPFTGFGLNPVNNPAAGFPINQQPVFSGLNNPVNNPLAQQPFPQQQAFPQQAFPQQNLMQQPVVGGTPQLGGLNVIGLPDQQIQQLALQAAQPTMNQWLSNDFQSIFQRAGALNTLPLSQPVMGGAPLQGVQALQAMPNTLAALQQQMQQPITQNLLQANPNLAQWLQQQQLAMQQALRGPAPSVAPGAQQPLPTMNINQPILQGSPLGQGQQQPSSLQQFNAPTPQDFTLSQPPSGPQQTNQPAGPQQPLPQPILNTNQPSAPSPMINPNPATPQGMPTLNAPRPRP